MHKGQKCIQVLWNHPKKLPHVEHYKECAICAILRENTTFSLAATEAKTFCAMLHNAAQRPKNNANPSGLSEKMFMA